MAGRAGAAGAAEAYDEVSLHQLVENAVTKDDVAPLLRILFSVTTEAADRDKQAAAGDAGAPEQQPGLLGGKPEPPPLDGKQMLGLISKSLQSVAAEQDQVIKDLCTSNAMEIAGFVTDLHSIQDSAAHVQDLLGQANEVVQKGGGALLSQTRALCELMTVMDNVTGGVEGVRRAQQLLRSCMQVGQLLEERNLYQAITQIRDIQHNQLAALLAMLSIAPTAAPAGAAPSNPLVSPRTGPDMPGVGVGVSAPEAGRQLANVVSLRAFFESLVAELLAAVEALAISEVHTWLVSARGMARTVGLRAIRRAAIQRQMEEDLARERLTLAAQLTLADTPVRDLTTSVSASTFRQDHQCVTLWPPSGFSDNKGTGGSSAVSTPTHADVATAAAVVSMQGVMEATDVQALHPGQPHTAVTELLDKYTRLQRRKANRQAALAKAAAAAGGGAGGAQGAGDAAGAAGALESLGSRLCAVSDGTIPLLSGLPMRGLLRCAHIHEVLGRTARLREYYIEQRRLQIAADLSSPHTPFLENYQGYLGQVVGFFVIEASVARILPQLVPTSTADLLWEGAAAQIKAVLERMLCSAGAPGFLGGPQTGGKGASVVSPGRGADNTPGCTPPIMVLVKDFVMLACDALDDAGCPPKKVKEVLLLASQRYHELLTSDALASATTTLTSDPLTHTLTVTTNTHAHTLCVTYGLPASLHPQNPHQPHTPDPSTHTNTPNTPRTTAAVSIPPVPFSTPFSPLVPALIKLIRGYVEDSAVYLRSLLPPWDMEEALTQARDRMVVKVVVECVVGRVGALAGAGDMVGGMMLVTDAWAMVQAVPALEAHLECVAAPTAEQAPEVQKLMRKAEASRQCVLPVKSTAPDPGLAVGTQGVNNRTRRRRVGRMSDMGASSVLTAGAPPPSLSVSMHQILDHAERAVLRQVAARVDTLLSGGFRATPWTPSSPLQGGPSDHIMPLIAYLQECFDSARRALPRASYAFLMRTVFKSLAISYMKLFSPDGVPGYNLLVVERLSHDISALQNFAARVCVRDSQVKDPVMSGMHTQFAEPEQLFRLLLSGQLEDVLVPELRRQRYPNLEPSTIVLALDKYKELLKMNGEKTSFPTRKQVDSIAKALRGQLVVGTAATVLQGF